MIVFRLVFFGIGLACIKLASAHSIANPAPATAKYYVAAYGRDDNSGTNIARPFARLTGARSKARTGDRAEGIEMRPTRLLRI
jgi:hypothetical protein